MDEELASSRALRTPRAAAVAGVLFALLLTSALVLVRTAVPGGQGDGSFLADPGRRRQIILALNLVPFSGIAFLWFIGVVRDRIGEREDRFFATVFLGSGLLFIAMLFVASAVTAGYLADSSGGGAGSGFNRRIGSLILHTYAMRMAAVFTISTATIALRTGFLPRWLVFAGYAIALILLLAIDVTPWVELLFPLWILLLSLDTLVASLGRKGTEQSAPANQSLPRK
jgi:hypothetical protein